MKCLDVKTYRKRPIEIHAVRYDESNGKQIEAWANRRGGENVKEGASSYEGRASMVLRVFTPEGVMLAGPGDWIIEGIKGEFYPCKADIFAATYDPA